MDDQIFTRPGLEHKEFRSFKKWAKSTFWVVMGLLNGSPEALTAKSVNPFRPSNKNCSDWAETFRVALFLYLKNIFDFLSCTVKKLSAIL
jgi:hypothetical protein